MPQGFVNLKLRPIKLGFLVDPSDTKAIFETIKLNTFYWGGAYNPIIPIVKRIPKYWERKPFRSTQVKDILEGYLDAYDPDVIIPVGKVAAQKHEIGNRRLIQFAELLEGLEDQGTPNFGIGLFEILNYFIEKELKFTRKQPLEITLPRYDKSYELAFAAIFGKLPKQAQEIFSEHYVHAIEAKTKACSLENYFDFLKPGKLFLKRFSNLYVKPTFSTNQDSHIFFFDAKNNLDIIDYWNLRAVGWAAIPIMKQASKIERVKTMVVNFIEENYVPYRHDPQMFYYSTFVRGRSVEEDELRSFISSLKLSKPKNENSPKYLISNYPRIWNEWARGKDGAPGCDLEAATQQHDMTFSEEEFTVRTLDPKFISPYGSHGEPRFVNEVGIRFYSGKEIDADVIPEGDENLANVVGKFGLRHWRFSKKGMFYLSRHLKWQIHLQIPKAEEVFLAWLKYKKKKAEISDSGLVAKQMIRYLGGALGTYQLAHEGLIALLEKMNFHKWLKKEIVFKEVHQIANKIEFPKDSGQIIKGMVDSKMIQLGIVVSCTTCRRHSWYSITDANYELKCEKCGAQFSIPVHSPNEIKWSYKAIGPFSLPGKGAGIYSVLLTLRLFNRIMQASTTAIPGFKLKIENKEIEVDLGLFFRESRFGNSNTELIFAECKTYNRFEPKDADRMLLLAKEFPSSIIVFSTLNKELNPKEKKIISKVANRGRRYMKAERPYNPVLILTGNELFAEFDILTVWGQLGGVYERFTLHGGIQNILELCNATQQIYLDLNSWQYDWREKWARQRQRKIIPSSTLATQT